MHGSIWLVTKPSRGIPPGICSFLLSWRYIPHPPYKSKTKPFHNFYKLFPEFIERRIIDVINVVKTWTLNLKTKTKKKNYKKKRLVDRILHKNTGLNLCLSLYQKPCIRFHISFLIIKARLKKYSCPSFPKNKIHSSTHHTHIRFKF